MEKYNLPLIALLMFTGRLVVLGASLGDAIVVVALSALCGATAFAKSKIVPDVNGDLKAELDNIKTTIAAIKLGRTLGR